MVRPQYTWSGDLFLEALQVSCILGDLPHERITPQLIQLDIVAQLDPNHSQLSDQLETTVNYVEIADFARKTAILGQFRLVEALAQAICQGALSLWPALSQISVKVTKFSCIPDVQRAGIKVTAQRQ